MATKKRSTRRSTGTVFKFEVTAKPFDFVETFDNLLRAISVEYASDETKPGVIVSKLADGYYATVVRYRCKFAEGKYNVCTCRAPSFSLAVAGLAREWLKTSDAKKNLRAASEPDACFKYGPGFDVHPDGKGM